MINIPKGEYWKMRLVSGGCGLLIVAMALSQLINLRHLHPRDTDKTLAGASVLFLVFAGCIAALWI